MKVSKRSLIVSIAVLCVCALSLSAASFAWFSAVNKTQINQLNMKVIEQSDLKIAIDEAALDDIEGALWQTTFTGANIASVQDDTFTQSGIAAATNNGGALEIPADNDKINAETGAYDPQNGFKAATAKVDYVKFTVYFRTTVANQSIAFSTAGFSIDGSKQKILPALTLDFGGLLDDQKTSMGNTALNDVVLCDCDQEIDGYYVGQADFYVYVEGTHAATINQNAGVNFKLGDISFTLQPKA